MKILKLFKRKKETEERKEDEKVKTVRQPSGLELICGEDKEVYQALSEVLLLDLKSASKVSIEETLKEASEKEKAGDLFRAGLDYRLAGQGSLPRGDVEGVKKFFAEAQRLTGKEYLILKIPERSTEKAQEYYRAQAEKEKQARQ